MEEVHETKRNNREEKGGKIHKIEAPIDDNKPFKILCGDKAFLPIKKPVHKEPETETEEGSGV